MISGAVPFTNFRMLTSILRAHDAQATIPSMLLGTNQDKLSSTKFNNVDRHFNDYRIIVHTPRSPPPGGPTSHGHPPSTKEGGLPSLQRVRGGGVVERRGIAAVQVLEVTDQVLQRGHDTAVLLGRQFCASAVCW